MCDRNFSTDTGRSLIFSLVVLCIIAVIVVVGAMRQLYAVAILFIVVRDVSASAT